MAMKGKEHVSPASGDQGALEAVLRWVERRRLQAPVAMLLAMHRPLMPLAWPAAVLFGSVAAPFVGPDYYERIEALRDPEALDRILQRLERSPSQDDGPCNTPTR